MDSHSLPENPYSSPNPTAAAIGQTPGAIWGPDQVVIQFEPAVEDYVATEVYRMRQNLFPGRARMFWLYVLLTMVTGVLLFAALLDGQSLPVMLAGGLFAVCAVVTVLLSRWYRIYVLRRALRRFLTHYAHEYLTPLRVVFNQEGFECRNQHERRSRPWSAVERVVCFGDHFLFTNGGHIALNVPRRAFANDEESLKFRGAIQAYVPVTEH